MTHTLGRGYKNMTEDAVHLYTECPAGGRLPIAQRDSVNMTATPSEFCTWCWEKFQQENPRPQRQQ